MSSLSSISLMSLARLFPSYLHFPRNLNNFYPSQLHNHHHFNLFLSPHKLQLRHTISPCSCTSPDKKPDKENGEIEEIEERELREVVMEILEENGVCESDCIEIASNSPKYAKFIGDSVKELDELSLWNSWMNEEEKEKEIMTFKEKVRCIVKEKGDNGKIPFLESVVGLSLSSSTHLARLLSLESLPSLIYKVKYVKEIFFSGSGDERLAGKLARRMMSYLSISVDEDLQQTLSFFEKVEARRGGLDMLGSADTSFRLLIESYPRLLQLSVESDMKPMVEFLENIGVPRQCMGNVLLLFPSLLSLDIKGIMAGLRSFEKFYSGIAEDSRNVHASVRVSLLEIGALESDVGRILVKYPWVLSKSIRGNYKEIFSLLDSERVPKASIDRAIRGWPLILGCSVDCLKPMVEQLDDLGVQTTKLGKVLGTSPQLLLLRPKEFQKVVLFMQDLGFDKESVCQILVRCPEIFATSSEKTLQKKVEFLTCLGILKQQIPRVIRKYPELFVSDVDGTVMPRLRYLMNSSLSEREIASMVTRFSPLLGYSINEVLRPKLEFLVDTMGKPVKDVVEYPRYFSYSLDKKIKPRFFVLKSRNINCSLKDMLAKNDDEFATEYLGIEEMSVSVN